MISELREMVDSWRLTAVNLMQDPTSRAWDRQYVNGNVDALHRCADRLESLLDNTPSEKWNWHDT